jgi:NADH:ubiquinone oxidoreductase subunit C
MMEKEALVLNSLSERFPGLDTSGTKTALRRIYLETPAEIFMEILQWVHDELGFSHLCTITGLDAGERFEVIYHISNDDTGVLLSLKRPVSKDDLVVETVLPIYEGATFYEREVESLLGITVQGLPEGRQYPLPDNWPKGQYPLRKDWKPGQQGTDI